MEINFLLLFLYLCAFLITLFAIGCIILLLITTPYPIVERAEAEKSFLNTNEGLTIPFPSIDEPYSVLLSVIVPAFDEEKRLPTMLVECFDFLETRRKKDHRFTYEVIIVSDGSRDKTVEVAQKYTSEYGANQCRVLDLQTNRGKGGAVRLGMQSARGAVLLFADADGATKFSDITKLEDCLKQLIKGDYLTDAERVSNGLALVCGSRAHLEQEAIATRSLLRTLLMHGFHALVWLLAVRSVRDTQCGFKLLTREAARVCFSSLHVEKWAFDVELIYLAEQLSIPVGEVSVNWTEIEGSKVVPVWSWLQMGRDLCLIWLRYLIGAWKIHSKLK